MNATAAYDDGETAICFMGHGTEAESNAVYAQMQQGMPESALDPDDRAAYLRFKQVLRRMFA